MKEVCRSEGGSKSSAYEVGLKADVRMRTQTKEPRIRGDMH
jgi:hypothetical protein